MPTNYEAYAETITLLPAKHTGGMSKEGLFLVHGSVAILAGICSWSSKPLNTLLDHNRSYF